MDELTNLISSIYFNYKVAKNNNKDLKDEWKRSAIKWMCTIMHNGELYRFPYWTGSALIGEPKYYNIF